VPIGDTLKHSDSVSPENDRKLLDSDRCGLKYTAFWVFTDISEENNASVFRVEE
jgi:hypothetical protein